MGNCQDSSTNESNYQLPSIRNPVYYGISRCQTQDFAEKAGFFAAKAYNQQLELI
jgi:hypothetical protein